MEQTKVKLFGKREFLIIIPSCIVGLGIGYVQAKGMFPEGSPVPLIAIGVAALLAGGVLFVMIRIGNK